MDINKIKVGDCFEYKTVGIIKIIGEYSAIHAERFQIEVIRAEDNGTISRFTSFVSPTSLGKLCTPFSSDEYENLSNMLKACHNIIMTLTI